MTHAGCRLSADREVSVMERNSEFFNCKEAIAGPVPRSFRQTLISLAAGMFLLLACLGGSDRQPAWGQEKSNGGAVMSQITINPVGRVERRGEKIFVVVKPDYAESLDGLEGFSHLWVIYWFHGNDTPEKRRTLKVHPRGNPANPLTGVFATRSPARPNLIGMDACRLIKRDGNRLEVEGLAAWDETPVIDLKPYLPQIDSPANTTIPKWARSIPPR